MPRSTRMTLIAGAAVAVAISLALGSVAAQDDDAMDDSDAMDPMEPGISVRDAWTRESMMVDLAGAAYMVIHNNTDADDALVGATSSAANVVEIHQSSMDEEGAMAMAQVQEVPIPAHADAVLEPGGYHIMLIELAEPLGQGQEIEVTLEFATAEPQTVMVPVQATGPMGDMDGDDMDMDHDMDEMGHDDEDRDGEDHADMDDDDASKDEDDS